MVDLSKDLQFFKVFLPEFGSHELVIPPAFIDMLEKPLPKEAFLVDEIGRLWCVETKTEDTEERFCVFFTKGWQSFANDQSLEFGDFLVFSYDGDSRFSVTIFANDGCKKDVGVVSTTDRSRVSLDEEEPDDIFTKPDRMRDCDCGQSINRKRKRDSVNEDPRVLVDDKPEYVSTYKTKPEHSEKTQRTVNRAGDTCDISWFPEKKHNGFEESVYKPKHPHFVRNITRGSLQKLELPLTFLRSNGIELEEDIELCDESGKKWPLKIVNHDRGFKFSHESWLCFCKSHEMILTNKCLFEFIVPSNGRCSEILVRIVSGRLPTTMTKNNYQVIDMQP
ncbi:DNA-binding pseudobarrel domain superfamily [Arabidopsis suecica]|uniref:DNA-binding pseudobarrel domain superfamily n=1 Tax=Arabidopsis suecica TaxID=45249 RepID=A0A8T2DUI8_ARASU|nr:DNA-binding pseudobarrel domain superfamily [Arabidopsis suecica]